MASTEVHHREQDPKQLGNGHREYKDLSFPQEMNDFREIGGHKYRSGGSIGPHYVAYTPGFKTQATYFDGHGEE